MTKPAPASPCVPHPPWCVPPLCDAEVPALPAVDGVHRGALLRLVVPLADGDSLFVTAQLRQTGAAQLANGDTMLALQVGGGPTTLIPVDGVGLVLDLIQRMIGQMR